jgi:uracil-DNA glycosylase
MVVGQAPGVQEQENGRPFSGPAGRRLFQWFGEAGLKEDEFRAAQYITAITKCYPGKPRTVSERPSRGDRVPQPLSESCVLRFWSRNSRSSDRS